MDDLLTRDIRRFTLRVVEARAVYRFIYGERRDVKNPKLAALKQGIDVLNHDFGQQLDGALARLPQVRETGNAVFKTINGHFDATLADLSETVQFVESLQEVAKSNGGPTAAGSLPGSQPSVQPQSAAQTEPQGHAQAIHAEAPHMAQHHLTGQP